MVLSAWVSKLQLSCNHKVDRRGSNLLVHGQIGLLQTPLVQPAECGRMHTSNDTAEVLPSSPAAAFRYNPALNELVLQREYKQLGLVLEYSGFDLLCGRKHSSQVQPQSAMVKVCAMFAAFVCK